MRGKYLEPKAWQTRWENKFIDIEEFRISYIEEGSGKTLFFIHGLGGNLTNWDYSFSEFIKSYHCIAIDLPGFGNSSKPRANYSIDKFAKVIVEFMEKKGIERASFIGNSMGGHTSCYLAINYPQKVESLVLSDPSGTMDFQWFLKPLVFFPKISGSIAYWFFAFQNRKKSPEELRIIMDKILGNRPLYTKLLFYDYKKPMAKKYYDFYLDYLSHYVKAEEFKIYCQIFASCAKSIWKTDLKSQLHKVKCPTLIVWGDKDILVPTVNATRFAQGIKGSELVWIKDCGHIPMIEEPDEFNRVVRSFLERIS